MHFWPNSAPICQQYLSKPKILPTIFVNDIWANRKYSKQHRRKNWNFCKTSKGQIKTSSEGGVENYSKLPNKLSLVEERIWTKINFEIFQNLRISDNSILSNQKRALWSIALMHFWPNSALICQQYLSKQKIFQTTLEEKLKLLDNFKSWPIQQSTQTNLEDQKKILRNWDDFLFWKCSCFCSF